MGKKGKGKGKKGKGKKGPAGPSPFVLPIELRSALQSCDVAAVVAWLNGGGKVDAIHDNPAQLDRGRTMLMMASRNGQEDFVNLLLERRAQIDRQDSNGCTALMFAAVQGHPMVVRRLLWYGADPRVCNYVGHVLSSGSRTRAKDLLPTASAAWLVAHHRASTGCRGQGPLQWAEGRNHDECAKMIKEELKLRAEAEQNASRLPGEGVWAGV